MLRLCCARRPQSSSLSREEKNVHYHHRKIIFRRTFLASKKNFPGRWCIQKPYKNLENPYLPLKSFLCGPHFFRQRKVLHCSRAVYAFFFPAQGRKGQMTNSRFQDLESLNSLEFCSEKHKVRNGKRGHYERVLFTGGISRISTFSLNSLENL